MKRSNKSRGEKVVRWALVIGWMLLIFLLSHESADGSSARSGVLVQLLQDLGFGGSADVLSAIVRKSAHGVAYAVLGSLVVWTLAAHHKVTKRLIAWSIAIACLYAISDEIHQEFIPGRSAEVRDVLLDTAGATVGVSLCGWVLARRQSNVYNDDKI